MPRASMISCALLASRTPSVARQRSSKNWTMNSTSSSPVGLCKVSRQPDQPRGLLFEKDRWDGRRCRIVDLGGGEARLALAVRCIDRSAEIDGLGDGDATFTHIREALPRIGRAKRD